MSDTGTQTLIRIGRLALEAVIAFLIVHLPELVNAFEVDPTMKAIVVPALLVVLDGIAKAVGGPTKQLTRTRGRGVEVLSADEKPSWLSV